MAAEGGVGGAAAGSKVRVVRCPKCEKLLPELVGFSVYRCGGCDATLQAKQPIPVLDTFSSEKSDYEKVGSSENSNVHSGKKGIVSNAISETDQDIHKVDFNRNETIIPERFGDLDGKPTSTTLNREALTGEDASRLDDLSLRRGTEHIDSRYRRPSKAPVGNPTSNAVRLVKTDVEENRGNKPRAGSTNVPQKIQQAPVWKGEEIHGKLGTRRTPRAFLEGVRFSAYPDEGPSNCQPMSTHGYHNEDHFKNYNSNGPGSVEYLKEDRAELLRKLDQLRAQLSRSGEVTDKPHERAPMNRKVFSSTTYDPNDPVTWFSKGSSSVNQTSFPHFQFKHGHDASMHDPYPILQAQNEILGYGEPFGPRTLRRPPYQPSHHYRQRPSNNYIYGHFDADPVVSYPHNLFCHQPACLCPHCCNKHWQVPARVQPPVFYNHRSPYLANTQGFYPVGGPFMFGSESCNRKGTNASVLSHNRQTNQRVTITKQNGRSCKALAGGAPFAVCHNCFELLQLPQKCMLMEKKKYKMRCGSCSHVISFVVNGKRLEICPPAPNVGTKLEHTNNSSGLIKEDLQSQGNMNDGLFGLYSADYDSSGHNVQTTDEKLILSSSPCAYTSHEMMEKECGLHLSESENMQGLSSSSSSSSASSDDRSPDSLICQGDVPSSTEKPMKPQAGVPLRQHFGYTSSDQAVCRSGKESSSKRLDQEKVISVHGNFKQNSIKDVPVATEICLSGDEYPNPGLSDSMEVGKEEDQPRMSKGGDSFFTGLIKKSFRDFSRFNQPLENGKSKVSVNGHPIPDRLIKKAEKQAGPIHPGDYWYDYRAGFWGVMGQPCLGIIPPFIEELHYHMPKNCAGGNTGVLVNGRELHQKDLDLLIGRGLPSSPDRSYIIEISGRVLNEVSGEELESLGKLAPTIEKVKHGFGMRAPRTISG